MIGDSDPFPGTFPEAGPSFEEWEGYYDDPAEDHPPGWRRRAIVIVAIVAAVSLAALPLYNLIDRGRPPVADNGLEVCGFDYCAIQDAVRAAGLDLEMSRLSNLILDDDAASKLADELTTALGVEPVTVTVVDDLGARLGGFFDPAIRSIFIDRPANAWIVLHEVAHAVAGGHGTDFEKTLIDLTSSVGGTSVGQ